MFESTLYSGDNKANYSLVLAQAKALLMDESDLIANMANLSSLLFHFLDEVNWVGFYLYKQEQLVLGPFHGLSACTRIPLHKGVCGAAATSRQVQRVADVHAFPTHIACDSASNSEIVLPLLHHHTLVGVLDIDSPRFDRFDEQDQAFLEAIAALLMEHSALV
ncbi:MAG: GAF domain-containing protein [Erysipelotrichaceae bacterium]